MRVVTFGEIMLRLQPYGYKRIAQAEAYEATYGGAEANVAVALAAMGDDAAFVTKLPKNDVGQNAVNALRKFGVDTSLIVRGGDRVGIYFAKRARRNARARLFTTVREARFRLPAATSSTGRKFLTAQAGFILPELPPRFRTNSPKFASTPLKTQKARTYGVLRSELPREALEQGKSEPRAYESDAVRGRMYYKRSAGFRRVRSDSR